MKNTPHNVTETVLFVVTGLSPGVITTTAWALANEKPPVIPDRIVVLTTRPGAELIKTELFKPQKAFGNMTVWESFIQAITKLKVDISNKLQFGSTPDDIRVFTRKDKKSSRTVELDDILDADDNMAVADFILEKLRSFVENPECRVIASIAGGRKTMSALLYACMTLIGRETDRLTHVLIDEEYTGLHLTPRFYFPAQPAKYLMNHGRQKLDASRATITLADIPFVPLRNRFTEIAEMPGGFNNLILRYSKSINQLSSHKPIITVDRSICSITVDGCKIILPRRTFLTLLFMMQLNSSPQFKQNKTLSHKEAAEMLKNFLKNYDDEYARNWAQSLVVDDIKREICMLRKRLLLAGITWRPGLRSQSLCLPDFICQT